MVSQNCRQPVKLTATSPVCPGGSGGSALVRQTVGAVVDQLCCQNACMAHFNVTDPWHAMKSNLTT